MLLSSNGAVRPAEKGDDMEILVETGGRPLDPWLEEFLRATVGFSVWHHAHRVEAVAVRLDEAADADGGAVSRCGLRAETRTGETVEAGATGGDPCEAIQEASHLLEVALFGPWRAAPAPRLAA